MMDIGHSKLDRALSRQALAGLLSGLVALTALTAAAEPNRTFNANALRGELTFTEPPNVSLNGGPARLAPGARIRGQDNMVRMPATLAGQRWVVNYTREPGGLLLDIWILTPQERARRPWPTSLQEARAWRFDANAQAWTEP